MIKNIVRNIDCASIARKRKVDFITKTVQKSAVTEMLAEGWTIHSKNAKSTRLKKQKEASIQGEDRWWMLSYQLGFELLSGDQKIATSSTQPEDEEPLLFGLASINNEVAIFAKVIVEPLKRAELKNIVEELQKKREAIIRNLAAQFPASAKRQTVFLLITINTKLKAQEREELEAAKVAVFDDQDIDYYEKLCSHLGPAAKYQLLADLLPGKTIPALAIRVPAVKTKIGGTSAYTFAISPEYLLQIAYVSHRTKGKASDVDTYQRMVVKSRLSTIRKYISDDGIFPTNIVLNLDKSSVRFERIKQTHSTVDELDSGILGWLDIKPTYKSAWIIDGQHRLYAYSGHERASTSHLSALAFEGLSASKQAQLFIDINAKQKSVKQSLLQELYAELHWDAQDPSVRIRAIVSKAIQVLDQDKSSPFFERIQTADSTRDSVRCISITSIFGALEKQGFFIAKERRGEILEYGPLWSGDNQSTLKRTVFVLNNWFEPIKNCSDWWGLGAALGGGLSMNDGVAACIEVLRSVLLTLAQGKPSLIDMSNADLSAALIPYTTSLAKYLGDLTLEERKYFRDFRGIQGVTIRMRRCQQAIRAELPDFNPVGLDEFIQSEKLETNGKAKLVIDSIETILQKTTIEILSDEFSTEWWTEGVPKQVRTSASTRFEDDDGKRGSRENYFDLIDYKKIALENWGLFETIFGHGPLSGKEKKTQWMTKVNEHRKVVAHASSGKTLSIEELQFLLEIEIWLKNSVRGQILTDDGRST